MQAAEGSVPEFQIGQLILESDNIHFLISVISGIPSSFTLESKTALLGPWFPEPSTAITPLLLKTAIPGGGTRFYRIKAN